MNKLILTLIAIVFSAGAAYAQPKVNITLANPRVLSGYFAMDVVANVQAGQTWKVGSSNIRISWASAPANGISVKADNPVTNANANINAGNYSAMTTTSISGGSAISLNITRLGNCHAFTQGQYTLGTIRFNRVDTASLVTLTINTNSVLQDSITQLTNPTGWTLTNPPGGIPIITSAGSLAQEIPTEFNIYQNYPNPFNPSTKIKFDIPRLSKVRLTVYDALGKEMAVLVNDELAPGVYETDWNASMLSSGVYFYKIEAGEFSKVQRMMLVK
jgi:hypothetical protein